MKNHRSTGYIKRAGKAGYSILERLDGGRIRVERGVHRGIETDVHPILVDRDFHRAGKIGRERFKAVQLQSIVDRQTHAPRDDYQIPPGVGTSRAPRRHMPEGSFPRLDEFLLVLAEACDLNAQKGLLDLVQSR